MVVDNNADGDTDVFHISYFLDKGAIAALGHHKGRPVKLAVNIFQGVQFAALAVILIEVDLSHYTLAIRDISEVCEHGGNRAV